jgi:DNA repair protein RadA/Sms
VEFPPRCARCFTFNSFDPSYASPSPPPAFEFEEEEGDDGEENDGDEEEFDELPSNGPVKQLLISAGEVNADEPERFPSGDQGLDHVLGGGIVLGSVIALYGPPGIGKSTLLTKIASSVADLSDDTETIYFAGEENAARVVRRIKRMGLFKEFPGAKKNMKILQDQNDTDILGGLILRYQPLLTIVDSLASLYSERATGSAGSGAQVKYAAKILNGVAKQCERSILAINHITKNDSMAGPKTVQHDVDVILVLEHVTLSEDGEFKVSEDQTGYLRLRAKGKNREGDTSAFAIYRMTEHGLVGIEEYLENEAARSTENSKSHRKPHGSKSAKSASTKRKDSRVERKVRPKKASRTSELRA